MKDKTTEEYKPTLPNVKITTTESLPNSTYTYFQVNPRELYDEEFKKAQQEAISQYKDSLVREIERQVIDKSMVADGCKVVLWADVLAILKEER